MRGSMGWSAGLVLCVTLALSGSVLAEAQSPLAATISDVKSKWPSLTHASPGDVQTLVDSGKAVLFDVRSKEEYAVSHLPGAVLVDPAMSREAFIAAHGAQVKGKTPVFYCAVGVRSSKLTERVGADALTAAGAASAPITMAGGIFQWNWENRALVDDKGPTDKVHGYDAKWGRLAKSQ